MLRHPLSPSARVKWSCTVLSGIEPCEGGLVAEHGVIDSPIRADYPEPLWIQAVHVIEEDIAAGRLVEGMRLPPERELCQQLGISRVTLRKALLHLVDEGVLASSHGRGWYVASSKVAKEWPNTLESFTETARKMGLAASSVVLRADQGAASFDEAEALSIAPGTPVFRLERIRMLEGVRIALDESIVPASLLPGLGGVDFTSSSLYELLESSGAAPERADSTIEATEADASAAEALGIDRGKPLLVMHQVAYARDGRAVSLSNIRYVGDRYRLRTVFSRGTAAPH
jgi:GntR family transcriptional regulator